MKAGLTAAIGRSRRFPWRASRAALSRATTAASATRSWSRSAAKSAPAAAPRIVMGDLNDVAWSHTSRLFRKVAGVRDPRVGRGPYPTFPAGLPLLAWPLDHIFVTPHFRLLSIDRLGDIGSDHWPMLFGLCLVSDPGPQTERQGGAVRSPRGCEGRARGRRRGARRGKSWLGSAPTNCSSPAGWPRAAAGRRR